VSGFLCKIINSDKIYLNIIVSIIKYKKVNEIVGIKKFVSSPDSVLLRNSFIRNALYQLTSGSAKVLMLHLSTIKFNYILVASNSFFFRLYNFLHDNIQTCPLCLKDLGSTVGIVTRSQARQSGVQMPVGACHDQLCGLTSLEVQWVLGFFPGGKGARTQSLPLTSS